MTDGLTTEVTGEELHALVLHLGGTGLVGLEPSFLSGLRGQQQEQAVAALLRSLAVRGLVSVDERAGTEFSSVLAALLVPLLRGEHWLVERSQDGTSELSVVAVDHQLVVLHEVLGSGRHRLTVVATDGDPVPVLMALVMPSPGPAPAPAAVRGRANRLVRGLLRTEDGEGLVPHAVARVQRLRDHGRGAIGVERIGVLDGGPGRVWLLHSDDAAATEDAVQLSDPALIAVPSTPADLESVLARW